MLLLFVTQEREFAGVFLMLALLLIVPAVQLVKTVFMLVFTAVCTVVFKLVMPAFIVELAFDMLLVIVLFRSKADEAIVPIPQSPKASTSPAISGRAKDGQSSDRTAEETKENKITEREMRKNIL